MKKTKLNYSYSCNNFYKFGNNEICLGTNLNRWSPVVIKESWYFRHTAYCVLYVVLRTNSYYLSTQC